jgi:antirestriction protein ArdC
MTNEDLISNAKLFYGIDEEAHTYAHWKTLGYQVKKGEKAKFKCQIWKCTSKKVEEKGEEKEKSSMFMKVASFFTESQVEAIQGA